MGITTKAQTGGTGANGGEGDMGANDSDSYQHGSSVQ